MSVSSWKGALHTDVPTVRTPWEDTPCFASGLQISEGCVSVILATYTVSESVVLCDSSCGKQRGGPLRGYLRTDWRSEPRGYAWPQEWSPSPSTGSSVQFSHSVVSDSLQPHGWQHARPPCPSPAPGVYSNSCPLSQWCHPTISSSVVPFSSSLQSFPASGSKVSQFLTSGGQSIGASPSVLPTNIQDWFPLGLTSFDLLAVQGLKV